MWSNKYKPCNSSTPLQWLLVFHSAVEEKQKEIWMKGLTTMQWINLNWNKRSELVLISYYCEKKTSLILLLLLVLRQGGRQACRQASRQMKYGWVSNALNSSTIKLFGLLLCLLSLQCYYSISTTFQSGLSSKAYCKVCYVVQKIGCYLWPGMRNRACVHKIHPFTFLFIWPSV